jgi:hypothetical protein
MLEWLLRAATVLVGVGLYEFETSRSPLVIPGLSLALTLDTDDIGLTAAVARIWQS